MLCCVCTKVCTFSTASTDEARLYRPVTSSRYRGRRGLALIEHFRRLSCDSVISKTHICPPALELVSVTANVGAVPRIPDRRNVPVVSTGQHRLMADYRNGTCPL